jgi:hypothetical protein
MNSFQSDPALQHVFEVDLLRRNQAQRSEIDRHVADVPG